MEATMSTAPPTPDARGPWRRWLDFWFAPGDPTTLGFIRIVTGCLCLYVHLAYSFDLQNFFGKDGWYGLAYADRERRELPHQIPPLFTWDEPPRQASVPEVPHRRKAVMLWLRGLTDRATSRADVDPALAYVDRLQGTRNNPVVVDGLAFVHTLSPNETFRRNELAKVIDEAQWDKKKDQIPPPLVVNGLPAEERKKTAAEIETFFRSLPRDDDQREFVLNFLADLDPGYRTALLDFIREVAGLAPTERTTRLDYLEYWNQEAKYAYRHGNPVFSLWFHVTDPTAMAVAHGVILVVMLLFTLGVFTRVTSVLTWLAALTYIHRTQQVLFGMDTMLNILLFYLMIGPSGAALSVDRLVNRYRAIRAGLARSGKLDAATLAYLQHPPYTPTAGFALRLLQIHFCFIYMASALSKLKGPAWWNHNAYWDTLANPEFTLIHYQWYEWLVQQAVSSRLVYSIMAAVGIALTFIAELGLPFLVWTRLRPYIVMFGFMLHAGIGVFMGLWIFSLLMMTLLLCYLPGAAFRSRLIGPPATTGRFILRYDPRSERQVRAVAWARALDFEDRIVLAESPRHLAEGVTVEADGQSATGPAAGRGLLARLGWARPVRWLPGLAGVLGGADPAPRAGGSKPHAPAAS
jgi:hypothetical protein